MYRHRTRRVVFMIWYIKERLSALILDSLKFSQNFYLSQDLSNVRCPWLCNTMYSDKCHVNMSGYTDLHILAWASALPSDLDRAMREAPENRMATDTDSRAFSFINHCEGESAVLSLFYASTTFFCDSIVFWLFKRLGAQ